MSSNTPSPRMKTQPVVILGGIIAAMTFGIDSLQALFKDNPTVVLVLSVVGILVSMAAIVKDQYVKGEVVPYRDTATYIDQSGNTVAGPAAPIPTGTVVENAPVVVGGSEVVAAASGGANPDEAEYSGVMEG